MTPWPLKGYGCEMETGVGSAVAEEEPADDAPSRLQWAMLPAMLTWATGVPCSYENAFPEDPTVGLCLGPYAGPRGRAFSYERGTPVAGYS
jgi:hypothetical protein